MLKFCCFLLLLFLLQITLPAHAQKDSAKVIGKVLDSILPSLHSPQRATLYSAILPGLGQFYNRKNAFWKIPLIVGGGTALGISIAWNNRRHIQFRQLFFDKTYGISNESPFMRLPASTLEAQMKYFRRTRDFLIIISVGAYGLQVLDAFVEGHLKSFNVDDNLSLRIAPYSEQVAGYALSGLSLRLNFGKRN